ncbi:GntR family transcriptional regulator [Neobacillus niacini]|uniref:GntR family transcriptional regulator n=1 Tax=Neobacillus niacini TaxID=86668 RepID=UPI0021CB4480|nr:GntR family transcriptional regulator [Neobacillus niacini]MCM3767738.1 GntR family transcriptional regulator [Neobacillus niacini]
MLDEKSVLPLYYQLKEIIKEKIKDGSWKEGEKVPSERELMEQYNISRATARKALNDLLFEGLIEKKQGVGTFVANRKVLQDLTGELAYAHQVTAQGLVPSMKVIFSGTDQYIPQRILNTFQLNNSDQIFKYSGVLFADRQPLILATTCIPFCLVPNITDKNLEKLVLFDYLKNECKIQITHSVIDIEPITLNEFEANQLQSDVGKPALSVERILYDDSKAVVISKHIMLGERCKYFFTIKQNNNNEPDLNIDLKFNIGLS